MYTMKVVGLTRWNHIYGEILKLYTHTKTASHSFRRHSLIVIHDTVLWSVCLSCSCIVLKQQKISTQFLLHVTAPCISQIVLKFGLHRSTPSSPFLPQSDPPRAGDIWAPCGLGSCRISPPRFLAECGRSPLNQGSFVLLYFVLFNFSGLYYVTVACHLSF